MSVQRIFLFAVDPIMGAVGALAVLMIFFATVQGHEAASKKRTYFHIELSTPAGASTTTAIDAIEFAFVRSAGAGEVRVRADDLGDDGVARRSIAAVASDGSQAVNLTVFDARSGSWTLQALSRSWKVPGPGRVRVLTSSSVVLDLRADFPSRVGDYLHFVGPDGSSTDRLEFQVEPLDR